ncbi:MAG: hypothetical protein ACRENG_05500 [bacterium]
MNKAKAISATPVGARLLKASIKTFRRQKEGGQKNVCRLLHPAIVNFYGMMLNAIFPSWFLFKPT